ncbi:MAG: hypothetical protein AB1445_12105 [Bacillota bacterium]
MAYFSGVNFLLPLTQPDLDLPLNAVTILGSYVSHILYGPVTAFVVLHFGKLRKKRII